jgi:CheY-like chemotaxis protein
MTHLLIIDSEPTQLIALEAVIKGWGHGCSTAGDAAGARQRLEENDFAYDAVLLDWGLPNGEGLGLLEWIKRRPEGSDLEVIIQSRREVPQDIRDAIHRGAYYYLTKPYEWPQLRALIQAAESSRDLKRSLKRRVSEIQDIVRLLDTAKLELRHLDEAEVVAAHLGAAAGDPQLGIAVLELLINAVEHGNLGISYEEKSDLRESGRYERELEEDLGLRSGLRLREVPQLRPEPHLRLARPGCAAGSGAARGRVPAPRQPGSCQVADSGARRLVRPFHGHP